MLLIMNWLVLYYLDDFMIFLPPDVDPILYKNYFNFHFKTLHISNNEKKKRQGGVVMFLRIELDFLLLEAWFPANKLDKAKLWITKILNHDII